MKKLSMIFVLLLAGVGFGQQHDRWNGLVIDETTPEQAIAKFGKPNADTKGEYANLWFARSLTNDIRKPIYRTLEFGEVKSVKIVKDKDNNPIGYVEMAAADADGAIEQLNESDLDGSEIVVKKAEPDKGNK